MKKLLMICLAAGYSHCFAQNIDLKELQEIQQSTTIDVINQLLAPKGYNLPTGSSSLVWGFRSNTASEAFDVARISRVTDSLGVKVTYETDNLFFYTNLVNQLPANGFQFRQTVTEKNNIHLLFGNGKQELVLDVAQAGGIDKPYRIVLQSINPWRERLPLQYNHKARVNAY